MAKTHVNDKGSSQEGNKETYDINTTLYHGEHCLFIHCCIIWGKIVLVIKFVIVILKIRENI